MGKPIKNVWFGLPVGPGSNHITVSGIKFQDGTTATNGYIVKQTGFNSYIVQDAAQLHAAEISFLTNATSVSALLPGQCFILATPFGGTATPVYKISQFRLTVFAASGVNGFVDYSWSTIPAAAVGQADLITSGTAGEILGFEITSGGYGYTSTPSVTISGTGGSGATATATVTAGVVSSIAVTTAGSGYPVSGTTVTIAAPAAAVTATATATYSSGAFTGITGLVGGHYYTTAPTVTISGGGGSGAFATAVIANGAVTGLTGIVGGTGYTSAPTITFSAPPASTTATATANVS